MNQDYQINVEMLQHWHGVYPTGIKNKIIIMKRHKLRRHFNFMILRCFKKNSEKAFSPKNGWIRECSSRAFQWMVMSVYRFRQSWGNFCVPPLVTEVIITPHPCFRLQYFHWYANTCTKKLGYTVEDNVCMTDQQLHQRQSDSCAISLFCQVRRAPPPSLAVCTQGVMLASI
jgi:hypothetical protein